MTMAFKSKNKLEFVDGTMMKHEAGDPMFKAWDRCNTLVLSWLHSSLEPSISQNILWMETTFEAWKTLQDRYYQGDVFRVSKLQEEIYMLKQGGISIVAYFTYSKGLWKELNNFRPIPTCTCTISCTCNLVPIVRWYRENDHVICFLKSLNEPYATVRSHIMLMDPLPSFGRVFSLLIQHERN